MAPSPVPDLLEQQRPGARQTRKHALASRDVRGALWVPDGPRELETTQQPTGLEASIGLAVSIADVIGILRGRPPCGGDGRDDWERIVAIIAENDSLPLSEVERIEKAIDAAPRGWSDAQRGPIWHETDRGMTDDDDDDSLSDTSFNGIG